MVKVCNAIMGSGKTSAAITYINEHPEKRFLYLTPYLDEARRIKRSCPDADFAEPQNDLWKYHYRKSEHTLGLIEEGRNVTSTHRAMEYYREDTIQALKDLNYTIIIDEALSVMEKDESLKQADIEMAVKSGYIYESSPGKYRRTDVPYSGRAYHDIFRIMESRPLILLRDKKQRSWYWQFSTELFDAANEIIVLTYLFPGSEMEQFLKIHHIDYTYIGVSHPASGEYRFADTMEYIPDYVRDLPERIDILQRRKQNSIGDGRGALSKNWYEKNKDTETMDQLRKNIQNFFRNMHPEILAPKRMCGTFKDYWGQIRGAGYYDRNVNRVIFNQRSRNDWRDHTALAYPVNVIINPRTQEYYKKMGGHIDGDQYALSIMIQWIWRSAIRDGEKIYLYLPSERMRSLLEGWIEDVSKAAQKGGDSPAAE